MRKRVSALEHPITGGVAILRDRWQVTTLLSGWRYPTDWWVPEIDEVCHAIANRHDLADCLFRLGAARAYVGVGLDETLRDVAALNAVVDKSQPCNRPIVSGFDVVPAQQVFYLVLGWNDVVASQAASRTADDPLTGLATDAYLRIRLREVCLEMQVDTTVTYTLAFVRLRRESGDFWQRQAAITLLAQAVQENFGKGETLAILTPSTIVVLARKTPMLSGQLQNVVSTMIDKYLVDSSKKATHPITFWHKSVPRAYGQAIKLLTEEHYMAELS